jgi:ATP-binding cassette, subfamily C, bacterial
MEALECGAAALGIVLEYYKRIVPLSELRVECSVSRDGVKASSIVRAARRYGLVAKGFKKSLEAIRDVKCPAILFWGFNHFVVLEGFDGDRVFINDPASGRRVVTLHEFDLKFTGVALLLEPGPDFKKGGSRPSVGKALRRDLRGSGLALVYCVLAGLFLVVPGLGLPVIAQVLIDSVLIDGRQDWLVPLVGAMGIAIAVEVILRFLQLRHLRDLRVKLSVALSGRFVWHVLRLPVRYFSQRYSGEVTSRVGLNNGVAALLSGELARTVIDCAMLVFYAALMAYYDVFLAGVAVVVVLLNVLVLQAVTRHRATANMRVLQEGGKLDGVAILGLQNIETLKACAQESSFFSRWSGHYAKELNARQSLAYADLSLGVVPSLLGSISVLAVLGVGGLRVIEGSLTIGMLIAFQSLLARFRGPVNTLVDMAGSLQTVAGDLARLEDVLTEDVDPATERGAEGAEESARLTGLLELRDVTFGYNRSGPPLIEGFNLRLEPGRRVALVGASGTGKSTLARLIAGIYEPWEGEVLLDGKPRASVPRQVLAGSLAFVEQDAFFFQGTIRDNLTLWDETVSQEVIEEACRDAESHEFTLLLPGGYGADLIEGAGNLSGGQRQRLEIAGALVRRPSILVLDEATSSLDPELERRIDRNLRVRGCTCVVIAHRLSAVRDCDEIVVLENGRVAERGTYDELDAAGGVFHSLLRQEHAGSPNG